MAKPLALDKNTPALDLTYLHVDAKACDLNTTVHTVSRICALVAEFKSAAQIREIALNDKSAVVIASIPLASRDKHYKLTFRVENGDWRLISINACEALRVH